jgi:hypothetical protein
MREVDHKSLCNPWGFQVFGSFQPALRKRLVDDHLGGDVRQFTPPPCFHLLSHGLEVPLHSANSCRDGQERPRVFSERGAAHSRGNVSDLGCGDDVTFNVLEADFNTLGLLDRDGGFIRCSGLPSTPRWLATPRGGQMFTRNRPPRLKDPRAIEFGRAMAVEHATK